MILLAGYNRICSPILSWELVCVKKIRPVNLSLPSISFPVTAIISILHRLSGILLFLCIPLLLWVLNKSLSGPVGYDDIVNFFFLPWVKVVFWILMVALFGHTLAGIRHLFMDVGFGETLRGGRATAWLTIGISVIFALLLGVWLW